MVEFSCCLVQFFKIECYVDVTVAAQRIVVVVLAPKTASTQKKKKTNE